jgi:hypothetical protein
MIEIDGLFFPDLLDDYFQERPLLINIKVDAKELTKNLLNTLSKVCVAFGGDIWENRDVT